MIWSHRSDKDQCPRCKGTQDQYFAKFWFSSGYFRVSVGATEAAPLPSQSSSWKTSSPCRPWYFVVVVNVVVKDILLPAVILLATTQRHFKMYFLLCSGILWMPFNWKSFCVYKMINGRRLKASLTDRFSHFMFTSWLRSVMFRFAFAFYISHHIHLSVTEFKCAANILWNYVVNCDNWHQNMWP